MGTAFGAFEFETDPQDTVFIPGGSDPECPDVTGRWHMGADARAVVIVTDADDADAVSGIIGQPGQVERPAGFIQRGESFKNRQVGVDHAVDVVFQRRHLFCVQRAIEPVVAFGFFAFDMGAETPITTEPAHHGLVEKVLGAVHLSVDPFFNRYLHQTVQIRPGVS